MVYKATWKIDRILIKNWQSIYISLTEIIKAIGNKIHFMLHFWEARVCVCVWGVGGGGGGVETVTKPPPDSIPHFDNSFSCYYQPNNYLPNCPLLMMLTLNSVFKHVSHIHTDAYKYRKNITKENFKRNNIIIILNTMSADEYEYSSNACQIYRVR